jgi:Flp pilus assembly protein TadD
MVRAARGDFTEAERLLLQSSDVKARTIGQSGPNHAITLNNLAGIYAGTGAHASAGRALEQALEIERRIVYSVLEHGRDHGRAGPL